MPRMRGPDATRKIRKLGYRGVIIGVTGNMLDEDIKEFIDCGADAVMPKPFDVEDFSRKVNEILLRSKLSLDV